jgi:hypothetical protein
VLKGREVQERSWLCEGLARFGHLELWRKAELEQVERQRRLCRSTLNAKNHKAGEMAQQQSGIAEPIKRYASGRRLEARSQFHERKTSSHWQGVRMLN